LKNINNPYDTIKETKPINGYFGYTFLIEEINHFVYGETKEEAFNFVADYINLYNGKINNRETNLWKEKMRKSKKDIQ
jgi:hypothetical protein